LCSQTKNKNGRRKGVKVVVPGPKTYNSVRVVLWRRAVGCRFVARVHSGGPREGVPPPPPAATIHPKITNASSVSVSIQMLLLSPGPESLAKNYSTSSENPHQTKIEKTLPAGALILAQTSVSFVVVLGCREGEFIGGVRDLGERRHLPAKAVSIAGHVRVSFIGC